MICANWYIIAFFSQHYSPHPHPPLNRQHLRNHTPHTTTRPRTPPAPLTHRSPKHTSETTHPHHFSTQNHTPSPTAHQSTPPKPPTPTHHYSTQNHAPLTHRSPKHPSETTTPHTTTCRLVEFFSVFLKKRYGKFGCIGESAYLCTRKRKGSVFLRGANPFRYARMLQ